MSDRRPGGEPTEPPSERRLREARQRGEVARSADLVAAGVVVAGVGVIALAGRGIGAGLAAYLRQGITRAVTLQSPVTEVLLGGWWAGAQALVGVMVCMLVAALVGAYLQVGSIWAWSAVKPQLARVDPLRNLREIFGRRAFFELTKSLIKIAGILLIGGWVIWNRGPEIITAAGASPQQALGLFADVAWALAVRLMVFVAAAGLVDFVYQRRRAWMRLRMTRAEVQREQKESEGDPQHKAARQRLHREIAEHDMLEAVARADCVVINPDHIAVALRYDQSSMDAPRVVARGRLAMAAKIREIALRHGVPIIRNVPLARALVDLEIDDSVPVELYEAVAEVLRFVYSSRGVGPDGEGARKGDP